MKSAQEILLGANSLANGSQLTKHISTMGPEYRSAAVPISKSHITVFLFNADGVGDNEVDGQVDARLDAAIEAIKAAIEEYMFLVAEKDSFVPPINIKLEGVGHFNNEVIFAKPNFVEKDNLKILWTTLRKYLLKEGFISENDKRVKMNFPDFHPHVTLMKMSRIYKRNQKRSAKNRDGQSLPRKFPINSIAGMENKIFGNQIVDRIRLLSMTKESKDVEYSDYFCQEEFSIVSNYKDIQSNSSDHKYCCSPLDLPSSSRGCIDASSVGVQEMNQRVALEKEKVRASVRESVMCTLKKVIGICDNEPAETSRLNDCRDEYNSTSVTHCSSTTKTALFLVGGTLITFAAVKIVINRLNK